ncbi:MAG: hypothetical protein EB084_13770 [Proteobacteria bacterium]|nr:hypothetical protein [Pseudomonadota bacterium]
MQPPPKLTTHLVQIEQAAREVALGQLSINEFGALITRLRQLFKQKLDDVREMLAHEVPADFLPEIADEMEIGQRGIEIYMQATDALLEYIHTRQIDSLQRGIELARDANDLVNQALVRNWQTYDTYQQAADEYVKQIQSGRAPI